MRSTVGLDYSAVITSQFYHDLAQECHRIYQSDSSRPAPQRVFLAAGSEPIRRHLALASYAWIAKLSALKAPVDPSNQIQLQEGILRWLMPHMEYVLSETQGLLLNADNSQLHYQEHATPGAAWHNLLVPAARRNLFEVLSNSLTPSFPHWQPISVRFFLSRLPPLVYLRPELSPEQQKLCSDLPRTFIESFLRSSYLVHLGMDPLPQRASWPEEAPDRNEWLVPRHFVALIHNLQSRRPRYRTESHRDLFERVRRQPPFSQEYERVRSTFANEYANLDELLQSVTFRLSISHAHSVIASRQFLEAEGATDHFNAYERRLAWRLEYYRFWLTFGGMTGDLLGRLAPFIPVIGELLGYDLIGTHAYEQRRLPDSEEESLLDEANSIITSDIALIRGDFKDVPLRQWFDKGPGEWLTNPEDYVHALRLTIAMMHEVGHLINHKKGKAETSSL
jgi:hypothetical protein